VEESRLLRMPRGTTIWTCLECGLSVRAHLPSTREALGGYDERYYRDYEMIGRDVPPSLAQALPLLEANRGSGRLLEIGCGLGALLVRARERGWDAVGIEVSAWAARQATRASGNGVVMAEAGALPFSSGTFDAVVSHHVLEHLRDPIQALQESHRVCRPGGRLLLILPNELENFFVRWALRAQQRPSEGDGLRVNLWRWLASQAARPDRESAHLFFFHPRVLRRAVESAGWRTLEVTTLRGHRDTSSGYPLGGFVKAGLYAIESWTRRGPEMILLAEARGASAAPVWRRSLPDCGRGSIPAEPRDS
jgi:SAM-dependent methyltransferase